MTTLRTELPLADTRTMLCRGVRRLIRYPSPTLMLVGLPVVLLLLFVFVLGGTLGAGLGGGGGRTEYLAYVVPGILLLIVASSGIGYLLVRGQANISTSIVMSGMIAIGAVGFAIDVLLRALEASVHRRRGR